MAGRASAFDGEKALCCAHTAIAATHGAGGRLASWLGARPRAGVTSDGGWNPNLCSLAGIGFFQSDFHIVSKIGAAFATTRPAAPSPAAHHIAENIFEDIRTMLIREKVIHLML